MRAWLWWTPLAVITLLGAGILFRTGWQAVHLSETDVINAYAQRYVSDVSGAARITDCVAVPGEGAVWMIVRCGVGELARIYPVNRSGALVSLPREPQT